VKEKDLYRAIDKLLPDEMFHQSMTGAAMTGNGVPDRYYDGPGGDLWVEYKMLKNIPRSKIVVGAYTALQLHWMERRYRNSIDQNVVGIVGLPNRTAVIQHSPKEWREGSPITNAMTIKEVAAWITDFCSLAPARSARRS
jgi:hypothetical protein